MNNFDILKDYVKNVCNSYTPNSINPQYLNTYIDNSELRTIVNFYDYDGTVLYTYDKDEFLSLTEMPTLPTQLGLICQGWNWSLEDAQEYVGKYDNLNIGATYTTDDGKTRFYIELINDNTEIGINFSQTVSDGVIINWGDGTSETVSGAGEVSIAHIYPFKGEYMITLSVGNGCVVSLYSDHSNSITPGKCLKKAEIGNSVTSIGANAFYQCSSLRSITIPDSVKEIGGSTFASCTSLQRITIPDSVTTIGTYAFSYCYSLQSITIPDSITTIDAYAFYYCYSLQSITIPDSVTMIGAYAFYYCSSLRNVVIGNSVTTIDQYAFNSCHSLRNVNVGNSVTTIGMNTFYNCYSLQSITIPDSVTSIGEYAFGNCRSLQSITIPDSVTSIAANTFNYCCSLQSITIPDSVTTIGMNAFRDCHSLQSITISDSVTEIGNYAFYYCYSLRYMDFTSHTSIPTLGASALNYIPSKSEIRVPAALYDDWCNATNWSRYKDNIVAITLHHFTMMHENGTLIREYFYKPGMTWREFVESKYNYNFSIHEYSYGSRVEFDGFSVYVYGDQTTYIKDTDYVQEIAYTYDGCCFVAGTQVTMADRTTKNIEDIQVGDKVLSYNTDTNTSYETEVTNTIVKTNSMNMARIVTESGEELTMTSYHPLLTVSGWKSLTNYNGYETLQIGDELITITGEPDKIINIEQWRESSPIYTYTLNVIDKNENPDVDENDNFYVNGFIGHNAGCK